jgi:hypothetical protein
MTRYRFLSLKIHADITTNEFCRLHNDKYTKYLPPENCRFRAFIAISRFFWICDAYPHK